MRAAGRGAAREPLLWDDLDEADHPLSRPPLLLRVASVLRAEETVATDVHKGERRIDAGADTLNWRVHGTTARGIHQRVGHEVHLESDRLSGSDAEALWRVGGATRANDAFRVERRGVDERGAGRIVAGAAGE